MYSHSESKEIKCKRKNNASNQSIKIKWEHTPHKILKHYSNSSRSANKSLWRSEHTRAAPTSSFTAPTSMSMKAIGSCDPISMISRASELFSSWTSINESAWDAATLTGASAIGVSATATAEARVFLVHAWFLPFLRRRPLAGSTATTFWVQLRHDQQAFCGI